VTPNPSIERTSNGRLRRPGRRSCRTLGDMHSARHLVFRSSIFAVEPGEDAEPNPGVYGKALASGLASELRAKGRTIRGCLSEDFGRLVHVAHPRLRLYTACANGHDFPEQWQVFTIAEGGSLASLFASHEKQDAANALMADVEWILRSEPSVGGILDASARDA
jgi:hypothetical protein